MNVGIVGGSIAGCAAAAVLVRAGHAVKVFERSAGELQDRGAGIGVPVTLFETLVARDLVDASTPRFVARRFPRVFRTEKDERYGKTVWDQPGALALLNWGALQRSLRARVPDDAYRAGAKVTAVRERGDGACVDLADGTSHDFDLVVCADGYRSLGRATLFPNVEPAYVGFVLWRGVVDAGGLSDPAPLEDAVVWPSYNGGHGPFFFVPGPNGRIVNWGLYLRVSQLERAELLTGKDVGVHDAMPSEREVKLKLWAAETLPEYYAEIVAKSAGTFVQSIYECEVPAYRKGRICLVGDAGALARPHTGTGAAKGIHDALALGDALRTAPLDAALSRWSDERTARGNEAVVFARQLGKTLMNDARAWSAKDAAAIQQWFSSVVTIPSEIFGATQ